jgi:peptide/nickel transport system substrate-binding protein
MQARRLSRVGTGSPPGGGTIRRRSLLGASGMAAAAALAGCKPPSRTQNQSAPISNLPDDSALTPQRGGQFRMTGYRPLESLNPWTVAGGNNTFYFTGGVYEALLNYDYRPWQDWRERKLVPSLAERWEQPDPSTYTLHIRQNVRWHDGQPFTADDVKWAIEFISDPANKLKTSTFFRNMDSLSLLDTSTIQLKTKAPDVTFLGGLQGETEILPKHVHDRGDAFEKVAVGTGAFKVATYDPEQGVSYVANRDYWQPGRPRLDRWRNLAPTDEAGRLAAFTAAKNDVLHLTSKRQLGAVLPLVKGARTFTFTREIAGEMYMKLDKPPFNDKRVRQAINMLIDRAEIIKTVDEGDGIMNPPGINAAAKDWAMPQSELQKLPGWRSPKDQDIQEAKQLLEQAGYANGGITFSIASDQVIDYTGADATVIAGQLRKLGITVNLEPQLSVTHDKNVATGNYQSLIEAAAITAPGDGVWQGRLRSGGFYNREPINDPELDRLIDAQGQEFDVAKRKDLFLQIQRLLAREVYVIALSAGPCYFVGQPYVHDWTDNYSLNCRCTDWSQLWFDQTTAPKGRT